MSHNPFGDDFDAENEEAELWAQIGSADLKVKAAGLFAMGVAIQEKSPRNQKALPFYEEAAAVFEQLNELGEASSALLKAGQLLYWVEKRDDALTAFVRGAELASRAGVPEPEVENLHSIAIIYNDRKDRTKALEYYKMAFDLASEINHPWLRFMATDYARALRKSGDEESAVAFLSERRLGAQASGDDYPLVMSDAELAPILIEQGKYQEALEVAREAYQIASYVEALRDADRAQFHMVRALNLLGDFGAALTNAEEIKARKRYRSKLKHRLRVDLEIARAQAGLGATETALGLYTTVIPLFESFKLDEAAAAAAYEAALLYVDSGNSLDAELMLVKAVSLFSSVRSASFKVSVQVLLAALYEGRSDWPSVIAILEELLVDPAFQFDPLFPSVMQSLAAGYLASGRTEDAARAAEQAIKDAKGTDLNLAEAYLVRARTAATPAASAKYGRKAIGLFLKGGLPERASELVDEYL